MLNSKVKQFVQKQEKITVPKTHDATVTRVDAAGTVWVSIDGGAPETPCAVTSVDAKPGDRVQVTIQDHRAYVNGNVSRPATDDTAANKAQKSADGALAKADTAQRAANAASSTADKAMNRAVEAKGVADDAMAVADTASDTATAAKTTADSVMSTAESAVELAGEANATAVAAQGNASSALSTANEANDVASGAVARSIAAEQTMNSLNIRTGEGNDQSLVRAYEGGVLAGRVGQPYCALVNAGDADTPASFDVVTATWEEGTATETVYEYDEDTEGYVEKQVQVTKSIPVTGDAVASFGEKTVIGEYGGYQAIIDNNSFEISSSEGNPTSLVFVGLANDADGLANVREEFRYIDDLCFFTAHKIHSNDISVTIGGIEQEISLPNADNSAYFCLNTAPPVGKYLTAEYKTSENVQIFTYGTRANGFAGDCSFSEGHNNISGGTYSHAEGDCSKAYGYTDHVEGLDSSSKGEVNHVEGRNSAAAGIVNHVEGWSCSAIGTANHVEGENNTVGYTNDGVADNHVEGCWNTVWYGNRCHVEGENNITNADNQHVQGKWNHGNPNAAFIIGNGTDEEHRSNAVEIDWEGNATFAGDIYSGNINTSYLIPLKDVFPIGTIIATKNDVNPGTYLGGTWERYAEGRTIVGVGESDRVFGPDEALGESTHKLVPGEMPKHAHTVGSHAHSVPGHSHTIPRSRASNYDFGLYSKWDVGLSSNGSFAGNVLVSGGAQASVAAGWGGACTTGNSSPGTTEAGGDGVHNNLQPYQTAYYWIKTSNDGDVPSGYVDPLLHTDDIIGFIQQENAEAKADIASASQTALADINSLADTVKSEISGMNPNKFDGKDVMTASFNINNIAAGSYVTIGTLPAGSIPINVYGWAKDGYNNYVVLPTVHMQSAQYNTATYVDASNGNVIFRTGSDLNLSVGVLKIDYFIP